MANENYRIVARDPLTNLIRLGNQSITPPIYDGPMTPEFSGQRIPFAQANPDQRSMEMMENPPANEPVMPLPPTTQQNEGMPGFGSMPMNMGLLQLGAGLLAQSGWQDEDISPGQALGRAMPGAVSSYMSGVKALQDRDLYKSKMQDILDARNRRKGLQEDLPGVIDNLKGKISGIPDARLDVIKTLVKSAPEQAAQIVSNLASQASKGKFTYRLANSAEIASGINPGTMMEVNPDTGEIDIFNKKPGDVKYNAIDGGGYLTQDGVFKGVVSSGSKASEKTELEKIDPAFPGLVHKDPLVRAAARWHLTKPKNEYVPELDSSGNETGRSILTSVPREFSPELEEQIAKSLQMDTGEVPVETPSVSTRPTTNIKETDIGYNALAKRLLPPGSSQGDIVAYADQLAEWNPDFPSTNLPLGQEIFTGPPQSVKQPQESPEPIVKKQKLSERQAKVSSYARQFDAASKGLDELFEKGYRPDFKIWNNILSRIEENRDVTDKIFVHEVLPGTQLSEDDKKFASYVLTMGTRSIRSLSGAALKGSELRDELDIMFPIVKARGLNNSDELEKHFRGKRLDVLAGFLEEAGALPQIKENLARYKNSNPFDIKSGDAQIKINQMDKDLEKLGLGNPIE